MVDLQGPFATGPIGFRRKQDGDRTNLAGREVALDGGQKRVEFQTTKPLPSYLLAFGVGPFDILDGGMAGNDWADRKIDCNLHPERPIPAGRIYFRPDSSKGNNGPEGFAAIKNGDGLQRAFQSIKPLDEAPVRRSETLQPA